MRALALLCGASAHSATQRWVQHKKHLKYQASPAYCASVREGKVGDGADVILWHCGTGPEFEWDFDGDKVRYAAKPEYCMAVREGRAGDGADVILWRCDDSDAFKWRFEDNRMKFAQQPHFLLSVREDKVADGSDLILWSEDAAGYLWKIREPQIALKADLKACMGRTELDSERWSRTKEDQPWGGADVALLPCGEGRDHWHLDADRLKAADDPRFCLGAQDGFFKDHQPAVMRKCEGKQGLGWRAGVDGRIRSTERPGYCLMVDEEGATVGFLTGPTKRVKLRACDAHQDGVEVSMEPSTHGNQFGQGWNLNKKGQLQLSGDSRYCATAAEGKQGNGEKIILWHCLDDDKVQSRWRAADGRLRLEQDPSMCISVRESRGGDGSDLILWTCDAHTSASTFSFGWEAGGPAHVPRDHIAWAQDPKLFVSVRGGEVVDGADLILWSGQGNPYLWQWADGLLRLAVDPSMCVAVREGLKGAGNGADVLLWRCADDMAAATLEQSGDQLKLKADPRFCVSVREGLATDGSDIILWTCSKGDPSQQWRIDNGRVRFKPHPNYCLTVREGRAGDGANIILWNCDQAVPLDDEL